MGCFVASSIFCRVYKNRAPELRFLLFIESYYEYSPIIFTDGLSDDKYIKRQYRAQGESNVAIKSLFLINKIIKSALIL